MTWTRAGAAHTPAGSPPNWSVKPRRASSAAIEAVAAGTADPVSGLTATPHPSVVIRLILFGSGGVRVAVRSSLRQARSPERDGSAPIYLGAEVYRSRGISPPRYIGSEGYRGRDTS